MLELRNKIVPSLSLTTHIRPDLALVLTLPAPAPRGGTTAVTGARLGEATTVPLVPPAPAAPARRAARTGAAWAEEAYEERAAPSAYLEHVGLVPAGADAPVPHPLTHEMISVLTEHALCAPVAAAEAT